MEFVVIFCMAVNFNIYWNYRHCYGIVPYKLKIQIEKLSGLILNFIHNTALTYS